jgi:hypothetical protein
MAFVLGAGASKDFGFPIGWELVDHVVTGLRDGSPVRLRSLLSTHAEFRQEEIDKFSYALDASGQNSVDAFLEQRREFVGIGKAAISAVLIGRENAIPPYSPRDPDQNWLRKLLSYMRSPSFEEFGSNKISFVTFNYDRSLEFFLCRTLAETFGKSEEEAGQVIAKIPIVHVHGRLGYLPWQDKNARPYNTEINNAALDTCMREIKVVGVDYDTDKEFSAAKKLLLDAERVYFMGVGFNNANMARLGVMELPDNKAVSTGVGLSQREHEDLREVYGAKLTIRRNVNCLEMLREHVRWFPARGTFHTRPLASQEVGQERGE